MTDMLQQIISSLTDGPKTARGIAASTHLKKNEINPILYREKGLFDRTNDAAPIWSLKAPVQSNDVIDISTWDSLYSPCVLGWKVCATVVKIPPSKRKTVSFILGINSIYDDIVLQLENEGFCHIERR